MKRPMTDDPPFGCEQIPIQPSPYAGRNHNQHPGQGSHRLPLTRLQPVPLAPPPTRPATEPRGRLAGRGGPEACSPTHAP